MTDFPILQENISDILFAFMEGDYDAAEAVTDLNNFIDDEYGPLVSYPFSFVKKDLNILDLTGKVFATVKKENELLHLCMDGEFITNDTEEIASFICETVDFYSFSRDCVPEVSSEEEDED